MTFSTVQDQSRPRTWSLVQALLGKCRIRPGPVVSSRRLRESDRVPSASRAPARGVRTEGAAVTDPPRRIVVSGGGTGLGRAIASRFAQEGDTVVIVGRRKEVLADAAEAINSELVAERISFLVADLEDPAQVGSVAEAIAAEGAVDVLVNNAGGIASGDDDDLEEVAERWLTDFRNNVLTAVLLTDALVPYMARPGGRIIAMSSIAGVRGPGSYGAAKAALHAWVYGLAAQLGPEGITVNAVAPGFIPDTEF